MRAYNHCWGSSSSWQRGCTGHTCCQQGWQWVPAEEVVILPKSPLCSCIEESNSLAPAVVTALVPLTDVLRALALLCKVDLPVRNQPCSARTSWSWLSARRYAARLGCKVHEIDVAVCFFNIVHLKGKIVSLIND